MKQLLVFFLMGFLTITSLAQTSVDIGIFGGGGTYFGDMTKVDFQKSVNPAYGAFLRYNFNPRYGLRLNVLNGTIGAEGHYDGVNWPFSKNVMDISLLFEFNYLKYIVGDKTTPWSTFLFGGLGFQMYDYEFRRDELVPLVDPTYFNYVHTSGGVIAPTIPFGLGVKYNLSRKWGIGLEGGLRKSLSDKLDDLDDPLSYISSDNVQVKYTDQFHNNDWVAYFGIHLVYKILDQNQNWELRTPRKRMLDWGIWNRNRKE
jgi:hypothetical protein